MGNSAQFLQRASQRDDRELRLLTNLLKEHGLSVRREKLSRGHSFRVKSGSCVFRGSEVLFVDRNLPPRQQVTLLAEFCLEHKIALPASLRREVVENATTLAAAGGESAVA